MVIDRVETVRWNNEWAPTDAVLSRSADDPKILGDLVDGTIENPEWRNSALSAFSELNAEAARRSFNSGDYLAAIHYQSRRQALELVRNLERSLQALEDSLLGAGNPPIRPAGNPQARDVSMQSDVLRTIGGDTHALSFRWNSWHWQGVARLPGIREVNRRVDQSVTVNISTTAMGPDQHARAEELRVIAYGAHL
ncbi:hypothetical protein [Nocardia sp. R7R-8]|uniref:hypothetical protein n=1 Tax=Nocardia sp. R7R-8 TaxID=3459304 RepID=UPI00403DD0E8